MKKYVDTHIRRKVQMKDSTVYQVCCGEAYNMVHEFLKKPMASRNGNDYTKLEKSLLKAAASESYGYNEDPIVSSDVIGMRFGSLFDATQTMVSKISDDLYEVQVVSWYDNENSYTSQMVRTIKYFSELA